MSIPHAGKVIEIFSVNECCHAAFTTVVIAALHLHLVVKIILIALAVSPIQPLLPKRVLNAGGNASYTIGLLVALLCLRSSSYRWLWTVG
jgi:hypothetical protein